MIKTLKLTKKFAYLVIILFFFVFLFSLGSTHSKEDLEYGLTFSKKQAIDLGLDWREVYITMLEDLNLKKLRISAYWDDIEEQKDLFNWHDLDWQIEEAGKRDVEIILAIGGRLPRWPECHFPHWYIDMPRQEKEQEILDYIKATISRYKSNQNIYAWQIENEPFLANFGECPRLDVDLLDKEIALARKLDARPIVITDSGELSFWIPALRRADIFGTTMYRDTYSHHLKRYIHYPIGPAFFRFKRNITNIFSKADKRIVIELQGEPWGPVPFQNLSREERAKTMDLEKFKEIRDFVAKTGFDEVYFWGVEWWYWEKVKNNDSSLWREAMSFYNK